VTGDPRFATDGPIDSAVFAGLVEITGGEMEFVDELVDTYLEDGERQVADLRAGVANSDPEALVRPAHSLKSNSLNLGATELGGLCRELEERSRMGDVPDAPDRVEAIATAFATVREALLDERAARATA
jgi:HPt (histidine-containing phosphotransfer) domain-containing protein